MAVGLTMCCKKYPELHPLSLYRYLLAISGLLTPLFT